MTVGYGQWFRVDNTDMRWLEKSPTNQTSRCDRAFNHVVQADEPRLMVDNGLGPIRKRGKKKRNEYLCRTCAERYYRSTPPSKLKRNQEKLF